MAVKIGNASISENGSISGKAGDQTGREVYIKNWKTRSGGWVTLRCKNVAMREYIAEAMEKACKNDDIGYDQYDNDSLWDNVKDKGFDPSKTTKKVETDCARLVRVCVQYAAVKVGLDITIPDFYTATLVSKLMSTGLFEKMSASKYGSSSALLERGMIQCSNGKGHTWIILSNGDKVGSTTAAPGNALEFGDRTLEKGDKGDDVKELQQYLMKLGYKLPKYGDDGDFGSETLTAVKQFQKDKGLEVDGIVGKNTTAALKELIGTKTKKVVVTGGRVNVRKGYNTDYDILFTASKNDEFVWISTSTQNGWHEIKTNKGDGWISNKYSKVIEK